MKEMMLSQICIFAAALVCVCSQEVAYVSVKTGSSISIPCLYPSEYTDNNKYMCLCKKPAWMSCKKVVQTDQSSGSTKYLIFDDKRQHVFSVTIRNLTDEDSCFLCGVSRPILDLKHKISLQISGVPSLYVDQQSVTAVPGGSVTIMCHYAKKDKFSWCKFGGKCISKSGDMNGLKVSIKATLEDLAQVTMNGLKQEHSGWYLCQNDGFQMPVNLTVLEEVTTTVVTATENVTNVTRGRTPEPSATIFSNATTASQPVKSSAPVNTVIVIASTTALVLFISVIVGVLAWKMTICRENIPTESQTAQELCDASVIYSTIVSQDTAQQMTGPAEGSVIYSTVSK